MYKLKYISIYFTFKNSIAYQYHILLNPFRNFCDTDMFSYKLERLYNFSTLVPLEAYIFCSAIPLHATHCDKQFS